MRAWIVQITFAADQPFAAELVGNLFVWDCSASLDVGTALSHRLNDVQMIKHVVQAAIIREPIQQGSHCLFRGLQKPSLLRTQYNVGCRFGGYLTFKSGRFGNAWPRYLIMRLYSS